jgi:predicted SprT family Zn-dependent metalloprotease
MKGAEVEESERMADFDFSEASETVLTHTLRCLERKYFKGEPETKALAVRTGETPMGCYLPSSDTIVINPGITPFAKICQIVLLHELVHRALFRRDADADDVHGKKFQAEMQLLWDAGAYRNLL